jgi:hypothetical protein
MASVVVYLMERNATSGGLNQLGAMGSPVLLECLALVGYQKELVAGATGLPVFCLKCE